MKPTKLTGSRFLATVYKEQSDSGIITPDSAEEDVTWVRIAQKGVEMSDEFSEGDVVLISPMKAARANLFEFDDVEYLLFDEGNILGLYEE